MLILSHRSININSNIDMNSGIVILIKTNKIMKANKICLKMINSHVLVYMKIRSMLGFNLI